MDTAGTETLPATTEQSNRLQRCLSWVHDCKRAVSDLRSDVKAAISNREKCCMVLSAAMAATLALESLAYSGKVDSVKEQQLQRLCAKVTSTVDLAGARVKAYGQQNRLQKYCKFLRKQHTIDKFHAVIEQLDEHSERAWQLADTAHMPVRRRGMRSSFSQGLQRDSSSLVPADSVGFEKAACPAAWRRLLSLGMRSSHLRDIAILLGDPASDLIRTDAVPYHTAALTRCRLRRGTRHNGVRCMVFINPETSKHAGTQGHVWWYIAGAVGGNLFMYDLGNSSSHELEDARKDPPVSTMHHDPQGYVWLGYKGGLVRVWSDSRLAPVCLPIKCFHADVKVIVSDGQGAAWVGSDSGNVRRVELKHKEVTAGKTRLWLESVFTLKHHPKSRRTSTQLGSATSLDLDDLSRADSARASEDFTSAEEPATAPGTKAHAGPVTAIEMHRNTVYTSGGSTGTAALHEWTQGGALHHAHKLRELVRPPEDFIRQASSDEAVSAVDTSSPSSASPGTGNWDAASGHKRNSTQLVTAHDNGQLQVWDMSTGFLQPVLRIGVAGPSARCLVVCKSLGVFATAHADGKLHLRTLPNLEGGGGPTATIGEQPVQTLTDSPAAIIQAHRSGMVSAVGANTGIITCGIFGSVMWWPEAELRSSVEAAGMRLPSETQARSLLSGSESPRSAMSQVLHRYFTPSSAALAQATLQRMHSSGDLQGSGAGVGVRDLVPASLEDSVDLDDGARPVVQPPSADLSSTPAPTSAVASGQAPPPEAAPAAAEQAPTAAPATAEQAAPLPTSNHSSASSSEQLKRLQSSDPAAQQFLAQVSRILEEGTARQETSQEMTGKIAHAASFTSLGSHPTSVSARTSLETASPGNSGDFRVHPSLEEFARGRPSLEEFARPSSGPLEAAPSLSTCLVHGNHSYSSQTTATRPSASWDVQSPLSPNTSTECPPFASDCLTRHDAAQPSHDPLDRFESVPQQHQQQQQHFTGSALGKSVSIDRGPHIQDGAHKVLQKIQRSSSSSTISKVPNGLTGSLSDTDAAAFQRPTGALADAGTISRASGSSLSSSIFGEPNQWVIDYGDLTFRKVIGEGSIGRVHLGRWQETDVAIKVLGKVMPQSSMPTAAPLQTTTGQMSATDEGAYSEDDISDEEQLNEDMALTVKTLEREVSIMSAIRHPNVVLFMGVCLDPPCMVTEFCARGSMFDVLAKARSSPLLAQQLDWPKRLSMALDAAKGMLQRHSHKPPILHRDLKSPNLLVDKHWRVKIADFNMSRVMEAQAVVSSISADNPRWLAPEVVTDQAYSTAADVYSFGLILWELLTWQLPWADLGPFQIMVAIAEKQRRPAIPPESELPGGSFPGLPAYLHLMQACWDGEPELRPSFESCIITLRGLLEQTMAVKSQQKAAGRASSPVHQPATLSDGPRASPPVPPTIQPGVPEPASHRPSAPDGLSVAEPNAESPFSSTPADMQKALPNMQQLQSNLMRPATPPSAPFQAPVADQADLQDAHNAGQWASRLDHHQAPPPESPSRRGSFVQPGTTSQEHSLAFSRPAHICSRDALLAFQSQGAGLGSWDPSRLSIHSQRVAARQFLEGNEQAPAEMQAAQQQPTAAGKQDLQRPHQDLFPGDLTTEDSSHSMQQLLPQQPGQAAKQGGQALQDEGMQGGAAHKLPPRQSIQFGRSKDALTAVQRAGSQSSHMSPFAGFAALTMARNSMDEPQPKSHRMSLEQAGARGRGKFIKALPQHVRRSIDSAAPVRKSLESQAPPPASSSGMRNSRDGINAESAQQAPEWWTEDKQRRSLENSQQRQHEEQVSRPAGVPTTIQENCSSSSQPDELQAARAPKDAGVAEVPPHDSHASGLSKFSPFASAGLLNAPPFD